MNDLFAYPSLGNLGIPALAKAALARAIFSAKSGLPSFQILGTESFVCVAEADSFVSIGEITG
ncbi:hypothetical protein [Arsenicibacter rosenii]|uniref:hypothetical protein n=1 Tax=Arsenicibacter rosenii TaxID=1750698 RepID=UPI00116096D6|nr:hypothetical protein [Arsenicibacter rosenii]